MRERRLVSGRESLEVTTMQTRRFDELLAKRIRIGLSDQEANELGRLFAEREGKPYSNASTLRAAARARRTRALDRFRENVQPAA
jgi:hypothetical protein